MGQAGNDLGKALQTEEIANVKSLGVGTLVECWRSRGRPVWLDASEGGRLSKR